MIGLIELLYLPCSFLLHRLNANQRFGRIFAYCFDVIKTLILELFGKILGQSKRQLDGDKLWRHAFTVEIQTYTRGRIGIVIKYTAQVVRTLAIVHFPSCFFVFVFANFTSIYNIMQVLHKYEWHLIKLSSSVNRSLNPSQNVWGPLQRTRTFTLMASTGGGEGGREGKEPGNEDGFYHGRVSGKFRSHWQGNWNSSIPCDLYSTPWPPTHWDTVSQLRWEKCFPLLLFLSQRKTSLFSQLSNAVQCQVQTSDHHTCTYYTPEVKTPGT